MSYVIEQMLSTREGWAHLHEVFSGRLRDLMENLRMKGPRTQVALKATTGEIQTLWFYSTIGRTPSEYGPLYTKYYLVEPGWWILDLLEKMAKDDEVGDL